MVAVMVDSVVMFLGHAIGRQSTQEAKVYKIKKSKNWRSAKNSRRRFIREVCLFGMGAVRFPDFNGDSRVSPF
jgi:hypothetical protein